MQPPIETAVDSATGSNPNYAVNPSPNAGRTIADGDQWSLGLPGSGVGWLPSRFLVDRIEAERAFDWPSGWAASTLPRPS